MEAVQSTPRSARNAFALLGWLAFSMTAALTGVFVSPGGWYADLVKPTWNPPAWLFGPVWTMLYLMMGVAGWLVWREGGWAKQRWPLGLFVVQWCLNVLWTPLFFGLHRMDLAFVEIVCLWAAILATVLTFRRVQPWASVLLLPYLAWVSFASVLNFTLWRMNA